MINIQTQDFPKIIIQFLTVVIVRLGRWSPLIGIAAVARCNIELVVRPKADPVSIVVEMPLTTTIWVARCA